MAEPRRNLSCAVSEVKRDASHICTVTRVPVL